MEIEVKYILNTKKCFPDVYICDAASELPIESRKKEENNMQYLEVYLMYISI